MDLNQRHFTLLQAMGIEVFQRKTLMASDEDNHSDTAQLINISLNELKDDACFQDIISSIKISIGEISEVDNTLKLGMFNWRFSDNDEIIFKESLLTTPSIDNIKQSPQLKKQLWTHLQTVL